MTYVEEICDDVTLIHGGDILLSGDLAQIKRELGQNKLQLRVEGLSQQALAQALESSFPGIQTQGHDEGLIIDTSGGLTQADILRFISQGNHNIASFGLYFPSLNDIFIDRAGEH